MIKKYEEEETLEKHENEYVDEPIWMKSRRLKSFYRFDWFKVGFDVSKIRVIKYVEEMRGFFLIT